ncbi:MAG: hypothetical protein KAS32_23520 [Candidatus Peribacteraceae bacterium]|nr:hypothetical protein [Candidatus Peribacteraceae bacterium]
MDEETLTMDTNFHGFSKGDNITWWVDTDRDISKNIKRNGFPALMHRICYHIRKDMCPYHEYTIHHRSRGWKSDFVITNIDSSIQMTIELPPDPSVCE